MADELTPMQRQYLALKREIPPGAILMFRLGDFYEMFGEDAVVASPILGATLTHRGSQPMCGVPYHALNSYLAKLIRAGKTAALCDQVEDPKTAKGLVRREITRIVTPGTVTEDGLLDETVNNYVAAVHGLGLALLDLATGEFTVESFATQEKFDEAMERYRPAETLAETEENRWTFALDAATDVLTRHFKVLSLDGFGLEGKGDLISAAGALLYYVGTTLRHSIAHVRKLAIRQSDDALVLDAGTLRHLQLVPGGDVPKAASLLGVLDVTKTPMGARTLRNWTVRPLARSADVNARLDRVQAFVDDRGTLAALRRLLTGVRDLERLVQKVDSMRANPRDLKALADSLRPIPEIVEILGAVTRQDAASPCVGGALGVVTRQDAASPGRAFALEPQPDVVSLVDRAIVEEPPALLADGGFIAAGYDRELDELREISHEGHKWLAEFQAREQARTGITKLKVKHVSTFGFVIEIPKGSVSQAPEDYIRRQTLTTGERYTTPELKEYESKVLGAQEKSIAIEQRLFREMLATIAAKTVEIQDTALAIGDLDATLALADRALAAGYVRPVVDDSDVLEITDGRHPIIEQLPDAEPFVPNSAFLNTTTDQIMLITGPNMAGKSTYIRQVATIAVMAQMGSFVPASSMRIGVLDRVFTRIGAGDDLARGRSTFLVEMQETANILNNATPKSLIVLDEIGRGTSTFDGISIAWSVAEYLHGNARSKAKTLFATHYHELTDLADTFKGVKNYTVKVKEEGSRVVFLRRIAPGVAEKSFGIHVGAMAGLPPEVVARASQILKNLEANEIDVNAKEKAVRRPRKRLSDLPGQMTFFSLLAALSLVFQCGAATTIHRSFRNRDTGYVNGATPGFSAPSARKSTGASSAPKAVRGKSPNKLMGKLGEVVDGGLISVVDGSGNAHAVSLRHIDAPAADQPFGPEAAKFLGDLLRGKEIEVLWTKKDAAGAISGDVYYRHEKFGMVDANMTMVKNGAAWQAYKDTDKTYAAAEKEARAAKRGLWASPKPVRPSEWRKRRK
jgi:DNA mismatch repair protein MutS